ncbi:Gfo/Idh/MocA family protein [Aliterella atlantica]|uniref:Glycosyl transferase family 2 n=1 Tax=Aliterella atlantica CENA595 TaxID=1618023 RepID=A0A0D8ZPK8_9CYAN|nr:Gfo/Idh/MocA family oxidoreductase [Aliterella atlantica]KJH70439.1 glycosyl transferase family 2 [Aliterella atlantica CENA595]
MSDNFSSGNSVIKVGIVGTGYAAKLRAETLQKDSRTQLVAVAGHTAEKTAEFSRTYQAEDFPSVSELVRSDLDIIIVASVNREHGATSRTALEHGKHVIVEYPLSLDLQEAEELIALAKAQNKLLHVEHIELLGGLHQALQQNIAKIGTPFYARYSTLNPQYPAPRRWTYNQELFGFPISGALSRIHRLTNLFGTVDTVSCQNRYWGADGEYYQACLCTTQLKFTSGLIAEVVYGKGETIWQDERKFTVDGEKGGLVFDKEEGILTNSEGTTPIEVGTRRGLFAKDTDMVLNHLLNGDELYVSASDSLYALKVADAARRSADTGQTVSLECS